MSAVISFTIKGYDVLKQCGCTFFIEYPFDIVAAGQMKSMPIAPKYSSKVSAVLHDVNKPLSKAAMYPNRERIIGKWKRRINSILRICRII